MQVYRLEFLQPDGRWTGPYCAEWMLPEAFKWRERMLPPHRNSDYHAFPDEQIFIANPDKDRYVCGSGSIELLEAWFGEYMEPFCQLGGHIGVYEVPPTAIQYDDGRQVVYQQRQATLVHRSGKSIDMNLLVEKIHPTKSQTR